MCPRDPYYRPDLALVLAGSGVDVTLRTSFGTEALPAGLRVLVGRRRLP